MGAMSKGGGQRWIGMVLAVLGAQGCTRDTGTPEQEDGSSSPDAQDTGEITSHVGFASDPSSPVPAWDLEAVGARISGALAHGFPQPEQLDARYTSLLMEQGTSECPGPYGDGDDFFELVCTTTAGFAFEGVAMRSQGQEVQDDAVLDLWSLSGDFSITYPEASFGPDAALYGAGGIASVALTKNDTVDWTMSWKGSWADQPTAGWMSAGISALIHAAGGVTEEDQRYLEVHGGLAIGDSDLHFEHTGWDESGPCLGKTTGRIWIREPLGYWYVWDLGEDCDGCGSVAFSSTEDLGHLCLDLTHVEQAALDMVPAKSTAISEDTGGGLDTGATEAAP